MLNVELGRWKTDLSSATQHWMLEDKRQQKKFRELELHCALGRGWWQVCHIPHLGPQVQFNVVVSAFSLSELPSKADRAEVVQTLWRKTSDFLVSWNPFFPSSFKAASQFLCFPFSTLELVFVLDHFFLLHRFLCPSFRVTIPILYIMPFPLGLLFHLWMFLQSCWPLFLSCNSGLLLILPLWTDTGGEWNKSRALPSHGSQGPGP